MKKKVMVTLLTASLLSLTGCSSVNSFIETKMLEKSGILDDEMYVKYQSKIEEGNIDEEDFVECFQEVQSGSIHVTFSTNNNLEITYYSDKECSQQMDDENCYLNPGEYVYADIKVSNDVYSSMYEFDFFNICEYDAEGRRTIVEKWEQSVSTTDDGYLAEIKIPADYEGKELSVEPLGKYKSRQITLNDYYVDETDKEYPLDGTWIIDDKVCTDNVAEISAIASYIISYEYDSDEYFYSSSTPECYYNNNEDGIVIFNHFKNNLIFQ